MTSWFTIAVCLVLVCFLGLCRPLKFTQWSNRRTSTPVKALVTEVSSRGMFLHLSQSTDLECSEKVLTESVWGSLPLWPADSAPITVLLPSLHVVCLHLEKLNEKGLKQMNSLQRAFTLFFLVNNFLQRDFCIIEKICNVIFLLLCKVFTLYSFYIIHKFHI